MHFIRGPPKNKGYLCGLIRENSPFFFSDGGGTWECQNRDLYLGIVYRAMGFKSPTRRTESPALATPG